jgi:DNA modification methylase
MNWPADKVERRAIDGLIPYARNARTHSPAQVAQIAASMREWGWTNPLLIDEQGNLIAGHGRLLAAHQLGFRDVPVMIAAGWSEAQKRAYVIADNKLALNAGWDAELLGVELGDLVAGGFDAELTGFTGDELQALLADNTDGLTDPDAAPDVEEEAVARLGDVWLLGRHRLVCGDSAMVDTVDAALAGVKPHLMVTDPPYGVEYDPGWRNDKAQAGVRSLRGAPGGRAVGKVINDECADWREAWALFPGDVAYVWHAALHAATVVESLQACGFVLRAQIIWDKPRHVISRGHYHWKHEPCWYAVRSNGTGHWTGDRSQTTVWQIEHRKSETGHGTQKPVECMKRPIENNSSPGQAVYEPFCGSGTTIIAAEMTGRACHAIELDPGYVDVAVKRWMAFTGKDATLEGHGGTFAEVNAERYPVSAKVA